MSATVTKAANITLTLVIAGQHSTLGFESAKQSLNFTAPTAQRFAQLARPASIRVRGDHRHEAQLLG